MESPHIKNGQLFDDTPYIHRYDVPNVTPLPFRRVENTGHDETFDHLKCEVTADDVETDIVRARIFDFPRRIAPPDEAA